MYIGRHPHGEHYLQPFLSHIFKLKTGCSIVDLWIPTNQFHSFVSCLPFSVAACKLIISVLSMCPQASHVIKDNCNRITIKGRHCHVTFTICDYYPTQYHHPFFLVLLARFRHLRTDDETLGLEWRRRGF